MLYPYDLICDMADGNSPGNPDWASFKNYLHVFQTHAGKSNDEIEKILEQESRLGILSAINYMYPFAGQSRPIIGSFGPAGHHTTTDGQDPGQNKAKIHHIEIELDVEDQLPLTPAMDQMMACRM